MPMNNPSGGVETDILDFIVSRSTSPERPIIRPIRDLAELQQVYRLTHDCYVENGYVKPHPTGMIVHYPQFDHIPETTILVAVINGRIVGSVSLTQDGPGGFSIDDDF